MRQSNTAHEVLKARVRAQAVIMRVNFERLHLQVARGVGLFEQGNRSLFIPQPDVEDRQFRG